MSARAADAAPAVQPVRGGPLGEPLDRDQQRLAELGQLVEIVLRPRIQDRVFAQDREASAMMGINVDRVISTTFFIGSALAGAGAILYAMTYSKINPLMGILPGLNAFIAAVLGGIIAAGLQNSPFISGSAAASTSATPARRSRSR